MTRDEAYILGYFLGDGVASLGNSGQNSVEIYGKGEDWAVLLPIVRGLGWEGKLTSHHCGTSKMNVPKFFWERMIDWGVKIPTSSRTKKVPNLSESVLRRELIAGYWDADGYTKGNPSLTSVNREMLGQVFCLLVEEEVACSISFCEKYSRIQLRKAGLENFWSRIPLRIKGRGI